ncbi:g5201 [Coccomyxa elongata]
MNSAHWSLLAGGVASERFKALMASEGVTAGVAQQSIGQGIRTERLRALLRHVLSENKVLTNELTSLGNLNTRVAMLLSMTTTPLEKGACSSNS